MKNVFLISQNIVPTYIGDIQRVTEEISIQNV